MASMKLGKVPARKDWQLMIVWWPHSRLLDVTNHAPWLRGRCGRIVLCLPAAITVVGVIAVWFRPAGLHSCRAIILALVGTIVASKGSGSLGPC